MPVLIKENKITSVLRDISPLLRVVISVFSLFLIFSIWVFLLYFPVTSKVSKFHITIDDLQKSNALVSARVKKIPDNFERYTSQQNIDFVLKQARTNKLVCKKFSPIGENNFTLVAQGRFFEVITFFESLNRSNRNISTNDFTLNSEIGMVELKANLKILNN